MREMLPFGISETTADEWGPRFHAGDFKTIWRWVPQMSAEFSDEMHARHSFFIFSIRISFYSQR